MEEGYYYGVLDVYYAKMKTDDTTTAAPTYETPEVLAKSIEVAITPNYREGKLYASNATVRDKKKIDSYGVKLNVDKIPSAKQEAILGREKDKNGVQIIKGGNEPLKLAIAFALTLDNGEKELWWLYKGQFAEPSVTGKTDADKFDYQTPTIEGTFIRRVYDDALAAVVETGVTGVGATVATKWFTEVYEAQAETEQSS